MIYYLKILLGNINNEFIQHIRLHNSLTNLLLYLLFLSICLAFIIPVEFLDKQGSAVILLFIPLAQLNNINVILQLDYRDGTLELELSSNKVDIIILSKFIILNILSLVAIFLMMPVLSILYAIKPMHLYSIWYTYSLISLYTNAFVMLASAVEVYFNNSANYISAIIFPLIVPGVIFGVLSIFAQDEHNFYINLLIGLNFIVQPIIFYMICYLIRNIYNV